MVSLCSRLLDGFVLAQLDDFVLALHAGLPRPQDDHWLRRLGVGLNRRSLLAALLARAGSAVRPSRGETRPPPLVLLLSGLGSNVGVVALHVLVQLLEELRESLLHERVADSVLPRQRVDLARHVLLRDELGVPGLLCVCRSVDEVLDRAQQLLRLLEDFANVTGDGLVVVGLVLLVLHVQDQREGSDVDLLLLMPSVRVVLQGERKAKVSKL